MPRWIVVRNGVVVTGDGGSVVEPASLVVEDGLIRDVVHGAAAAGAFESAERVIDAAGMAIIPGVINNHAHGVAFGPFQPNAQAPLSREHVLQNLDRHL